MAEHRRRIDMDEALGDVTDPAVREVMRAMGVYRMIHGHTHRPAVHVIDGLDHPGERIVLADWRDSTGEALWIENDGKFRRELLR